MYELVFFFRLFFLFKFDLEEKKFKVTYIPIKNHFQLKMLFFKNIFNSFNTLK